jgi:hypothetical protein
MLEKDSRKEVEKGRAKERLEKDSQKMAKKGRARERLEKDGRKRSRKVRVDLLRKGGERSVKSGRERQS